MRRGTNLPAVGGFNQTVILDVIRRSPEALSRVELAEKTGLAPQTISNVTRRLLDDGLITEAGKHIQGRGKPRVMLELAPQSRYALGVHLDPAVITYAVLDLRGQVVHDASMRTPRAGRPDEIIASMAAALDELIEASGVDREKILGIGIAAPGPVDVARGIVLDPPHLEGWRDVPLRDALFEATGLPVLLEKDVTAAAIAELWLSGEAQHSDFAFFYLGTGIGIGLALDGEVLRGSTGNAGEGGTLVVPVDGLVDGRRSDLLGHLATPRYMLEQAADEGVLVPAPPANDMVAIDEGFDELVRLAEAGDAGALRILDRAASLIASALVSVVNLLDIDEVIFGGPFWERVSARFIFQISRIIDHSPDRVTRHPVALSGSSIGDDVAAVGAACLVLDHALSPRPSGLLITG
ncbi:ROK family transcriptional regulator [Compostimonas suwonensis]|uniref:Putative NBD/HSP70 family sugar kinase n=1 Tax=Compostimonas suwonensis TaxID=1048394 RepID=A0A2M9BVA9_9MICO|nr:ROK family transcriptional regulator [Compostimonas suwonensis]PJJ61893.1 putative NBD/HSP70 family sugar kinase [Compostimonas suwonensis]